MQLDGDQPERAAPDEQVQHMRYPNYSIVIPAYNESARILPALESVVACVRERGWAAEVIVVDDGSRDRTAEIVRGFAANSS